MLLKTVLHRIYNSLYTHCSDTIQYELERNKHLVTRLLSDITYQSADNLVDGLTKAEEEGYTYEHYYGNRPYQNYGKDYK